MRTNNVWAVANVFFKLNELKITIADEMKPDM